MGMWVAGELPINIKQPKKQQRSTCNARKPNADPIAQRDPEPRDDEPESGGKKHMTAPGERRDAERFGPVPALRSRGEHKRQPMRRNRGVKKSDAEAGDRDAGENRVSHAIPATAYADSHRFRREMKERWTKPVLEIIRDSSSAEKNRAGGIRTRGLLHPRQALYQAEPQPEVFAPMSSPGPAIPFGHPISRSSGAVASHSIAARKSVDNPAPARTFGIRFRRRCLLRFPSLPP